MNVVLFLCLAMQLLSVLLASWRLAKGPTAVDRVVIFDLLTSAGIALLLTYALLRGEKTLVDVALLFTFVAWVSTVALARYLEGERES